jgi:hypothetical protein
MEYIQDPDATLDYVIDWSTWLGADTISDSSWSATSGITIDSDSNTTTTATVWLSGGTPGQTYAVTNHIITAAGREDDRTLFIRISSQ